MAVLSAVRAHVVAVTAYSADECVLWLGTLPCDGECALGDVASLHAPTVRAEPAVAVSADVASLDNIVPRMAFRPTNHAAAAVASEAARNAFEPRLLDEGPPGPRQRAFGIGFARRSEALTRAGAPRAAVAVAAGALVLVECVVAAVAEFEAGATAPERAN